MLTPLLFALLFSPVNNAPLAMEVKYSVDATSSIKIAGESNVSPFECLYSEGLPAGYVTIIRDGAADQEFEFSKSALDIKIKSFDCKNSLMNRDLYNAMNADKNPFIRVELQRAFLVKSLPGVLGKRNVTIEISLTINETCKQELVEMSIESTPNNRLIIRGSKSIKMTDYNITPPSAMMGLIKVKNLITIQFELVVLTDGVSSYALAS